MNMKPIQPPQVTINVDDLKDILCKCGNNTFTHGVMIKKMSALISPDGQDKYIHNKVAICVQCFTPLPQKP